MQKVVGSNPISRFASIPLHLGRSALAGENQTTPHSCESRHEQSEDLPASPPRLGPRQAGAAAATGTLARS
jgi:hypothetical protein